MGEQERVFRMIPAGEHEFVRLGDASNTYIESPKLLLPTSK